MTQQVCPFLGTLDSNNRRGPHVEFPSFENHCLAGGTPELILLGDQATYCLAAACTSCPRYRASRQEQALGGGFVPFVNTAEDTWSAQAASAPDLVPLGSALDVVVIVAKALEVLRVALRTALSNGLDMVGHGGRQGASGPLTEGLTR